jgi:hypothetical protein
LKEAKDKKGKLTGNKGKTSFCKRKVIKEMTISAKDILKNSFNKRNYPKGKGKNYQSSSTIIKDIFHCFRSTPYRTCRI